MATSGTQEVNKKQIKRINNLIENEPDYIKGFSSFMNYSSLGTKYTYLTYVINFIRFVDKDPIDYTFDDFLYYIERNKYKDNGEQNTQSYQIAVYSALKKYSEYLFASKKISDNFMKHVCRPKAFDSQKTIEKRMNGFLEENEIKELLDALNRNDVNTYRQTGSRTNFRDKLIIKTFLITGIRCTALVKLDKSSVNFSNNTIIVTDKGSKVKIFEMPKEYMDDLKLWINLRDNTANKDTDALFVTKYGNRITQESVSKITLKYTRRIKNKHITPHKLRATYGTQLYDNTGDVYFVQECMGHSSPKTTELYIRGNKNRTKDAAQIINNIIK